MANICNSTYRITGEAEELDTLYALMLKLRKEKENGCWVGHIVEALNDGKIPEHLYVRGWWEEDIERGKDYICFSLNSAWEPIYEAWDFICSKFQSLRAYFIGDEPGCEVFLKRDHELYHWFPENFYVDACSPDGQCINDYFTTLDDAFRDIEKLAGINIITLSDVEALNIKWNEEDEDSYIYLHEFTEV